VSSLSSAIERYNLDVIGHTYCLIPIGSPLKSLREASLRELSKCLPIFSDLGASKMNVHLDGGFSLSREDDTISYNIEVIKTLKKYGYDGTVTLEIFSEYREYLLTSKKIVEKLWEEV
jgi:sugar phosphate isomerase/epimerase